MSSYANVVGSLHSSGVRDVHLRVCVRSLLISLISFVFLYPGCSAFRIPNFLGVIPGGQSFAIPEGPITRVQAQGTGFSWVTNVRGGTTLMLVGGDNRGNGTGGSVFSVVSSGIDNNSTCLSQNSPSSTAGNPAGMPTSVSGGGSSTDGG